MDGSHSASGLEVEAAQSPEERRVLAAEALKHGLFLPQGQLQFTLQDLRVHPEAYALAGLWKQGILCGLGLVEKEASRCQAYVSPEVRQQGAGRQVMAAALVASGRSVEALHAHPGDPFVSSLRFWRALGVAVWAANPGVDHGLEALMASSESSKVVVPMFDLLTQDMLGSLLLALPPSCVESSRGVAGRFMDLMVVAEGSHDVHVDFDVRREFAVFRSVSGVLQVALGTPSADGAGVVVGESLPLVGPVRGWPCALVDVVKACAVPPPVVPKKVPSVAPRCRLK